MGWSPTTTAGVTDCVGWRLSFNAMFIFASSKIRTPNSFSLGVCTTLQFFALLFQETEMALLYLG
jgi:hypothetical protein